MRRASPGRSPPLAPVPSHCRGSPGHQGVGREVDGVTALRGKPRARDDRRYLLGASGMGYPGGGQRRSGNLLAVARRRRSR